jgi:hypothetical protein
LIARLLMICLWKSGPQDLPHAPRLLGQLLLALAALQFVVGLWLEMGEQLGLRVLVYFGFLVLPIQGLLALRGRRERFVQTALAFAGAGLLFSLAQLPLIPLLESIDAARVQSDGLSPLQALSLWLFLGLAAWKLAVDAHIWRHALEAPPLAAIALSLALMMAEIAVGQRLFGATEAATP